MGHDVFLSHSSKDKLTADAVCAVLESQGLSCWIAPRDIIPGKEWGASIIEAIKGAKVMVLIFSSSANGSPQINKEVERAVHFAVPVIPMRIEDIVPTESLEYFLSSPHWLDAFTPPMDKHLLELAQAVQRLISKPPAEGSPAPALDTQLRAKVAAAESSRRREGNAAAPRPAPSPIASYAKWAAIPIILLALALGWYFGMRKPGGIDKAPAPVTTVAQPPPVATPVSAAVAPSSPVVPVQPAVAVVPPPASPGAGIQAQPVSVVSTPAAPAISASGLPSIAVADFSSDERTGLTHGLPDILSDDLVNSQSFDVYERDKFATIMREQGLQASGLVDPRSAVALGKVAGVHYILTGQIIGYGHESHTFNGYGITTRSTIWRLEASIEVIDVQTSKVLFSRQDEADETVNDSSGLSTTDTMMDKKLAKELADKFIQALEAADIQRSH